MIIGDSKKFAIEYCIQKDNYGLIQIWINGICIGKREKTYLKPIIDSLKRIRKYSNIYNLNITMYPPETIFNFIIENENTFRYTLIGFGETFDYLDIRVYEYFDEIVFLWKGNSKKSEINCGVISKEYFDSILSKAQAPPLWLLS